MGSCISKSSKKHPKPLPPPSQTLQNLQKLAVPNPLSIKSSTNIRISEDRDSVNCNKPQSNRNSHPTKKKNLTSFNVTDCDVTFTNNNMDISPIYVPKSSYHEQMNIKNRKESEANNNPNSNGNNNKNNSNNNNNNNNNNHKIFNNNIAFMKTNSLNLVNKSCFTLKTRESRVISQENFAFLKKNLEDFFRNRPKEDFQQDFQPNYIASDSQEQEDPPFLNISVIELESNSKEEFKNENFPNNTMKKEEYRNQLILLTQEILKDSQESSFPKEEIGFHMFNAFENEINWVLSKDEEDMLMKYAKLWHQLSNCYQDLGLWTECLNCLLPLATLYYQLGLTKQLNVCQIDAYLIQIMLILSQNTNKKNVINGDSKEIQRNSMLLCFIEEKLKNEKNLEEMKPVLSFLRFFQGVLTKNFELCKEVLRDFEGLHMVTCEEYQDLFDFVNLKENSLKKLKWLLKIEEMDQITKQIFKEFLIERVQLFKEKTLKNWDRAYGLKIPFKHKEISKLLVKMGNLLRIWLDLPHQAIFFYESAYKFDPKCLKALFFIALTLRSIGKSSLALEFYSQALKYNRNFVDCYFNSGNIYFEDLMNLKEAEKAYKEALFRYSEAKDPPLVNVGRIFNLLAEVKYQNQEYKTAVLLNVQGIINDLAYEENYHDLLKNIKHTSFTGHFLEFFQWISELLSLHSSADIPLKQDQLREERKLLLKLFSSHIYKENQYSNFFFEKKINERIFQELKNLINDDKKTNELLFRLAGHVFQDLEEYVIYMSSKESMNLEGGSSEVFYQKLCFVFNNC